MTLPTHAQFVVIGGGIIGCSTAYHLARDHKADVILLEQGKLTSGSTWHAAGLVGQLRSSASITQVLKYSVELYKRLEAETGLATGWKMTGCLRLATNEDRWTEYRRLATTARSFGMDMQLVSPAEVEAHVAADGGRRPRRRLVAADRRPGLPSDITQSLAKGARMHGAKLFEGVRVTGFEMDGERITAVADRPTAPSPARRSSTAPASGRGRSARMAGINVPLQPVKHQYIVTEKIDGLAPDAPTIRDPDRRTYFKEEVGGLVMGGYEPNPIAWTTGDVPDDFEFRLFDDDWDHFEQHLTAGDRPHPGARDRRRQADDQRPGELHARRQLHPRRGARSAPTCSSAPASTPSASPRAAAPAGCWRDWAATGEAPMDLWVVDIRRFSGMHRDRDWVRERTLEAYGKHYTIGFPHEEYETRPPAHRLAALRAAEGAWRGVRLEARLGAAQLVRAARVSSPRTSTRWAGRTGSSRSATSTGWCARRSASSTSRPSPSTRSPAATPSRR